MFCVSPSLIEGNKKQARRSPTPTPTPSQLTTWFRAAGLNTTLDAVANVRGGVGPLSPPGSRATLILGSHYDTVVDGGRFDGALGIVAALAAVAAVSEAIPPDRWARGVEVAAFSDEEGVRFGTTFLGSGALAGTLLPSGALATAVDAAGVTLGEALGSVTPADVAAAAVDAGTVRGYVEAHAEQSPRLERGAETPASRLAAVSAISGQTRLVLTVTGEAGHAGTVAMSDRRDAGAAAAAAVVAVERVCGGSPPRWRAAAVPAGGRIGRAMQAAVGRVLVPAVAAAAAAVPPRVASAAAALWPRASPHTRAGLVCTVGSLTLTPGVSNVIAGGSVATIDVRSPRDADRVAAVGEITLAIQRACAARRVDCDLLPVHDANASIADWALTAAVTRAAQASKGLWDRVAKTVPAIAAADPPRSLPVAPTPLASGAGHDALALSRALSWAMLFVRDEGGVSHTPRERVRAGDVAAAAAALAEVVAEHVLGE